MPANEDEDGGNLPRTRISITINGVTHSGHYEVNAHLLKVTFRDRSRYEDLGRFGWYPGEIARELFRRLVAETLGGQR